MIKMLRINNLLLPLLCLLLGACSSRTLESESGLYSVQLEHTPKLGVKGIWLNGKGKAQLAQKSGIIYVRPLNVKAIQKKAPIAAKEMREHMHGYITRELRTALEEINKKNRTNWTLCTTPSAHADVTIDLAVVHFSPQRPILRVLVEVLSFWSPVPFTSTMAAPASSGDICIEGIVRNNHTGELMMAFKDENRKLPRYTRAEAYRRSGNADSNLEFWAHKLAYTIRKFSLQNTGTSLKQRIRTMDVVDVATMRAGDKLEDVTDSVDDVTELIKDATD
ncbi:MAG: hypothetical protein IJN29_15195 [Akkermansia sp.]|nr:hypothetical protein [Akkermansia sp.]